MFVYHVWSVHLVRTVYRCQSNEHGEIRKWPNSSSSSIHVEIKLRRNKESEEDEQIQSHWGIATTMPNLLLLLFSLERCAYSLFHSRFPSAMRATIRNRITNSSIYGTFLHFILWIFLRLQFIRIWIVGSIEHLCPYTLNACVCVVYLVRLSQRAALVTIRHACVYPSSPFCQSLWYAFRHISALSHTITICWSLFFQIFFSLPLSTLCGGSGGGGCTGGRILICSVAFASEVLTRNPYMCWTFWIGYSQIVCCPEHTNWQNLKENDKFLHTNAHTHPLIHAKWIPHTSEYYWPLLRVCIRNCEEM